MDDLQRTILNAALPNIVFDGWTDAALEKAATAIGLPAIDARRAFTGGAIEALDCFTQDADARMMQALENDYSLSEMKIRERIATAVMVRLRQNTEHREAVRRGAATYALPWNMRRGTAALYRTVDLMWRAAGDTSTDYNFYTKRGLLAKVYLSTLYVWLNDDSADLADTQAFLYRRIEDVMQIQKAKAKLSQFTSGLSSRFGSAKA